MKPYSRPTRAKTTKPVSDKIDDTPAVSVDPWDGQPPDYSETFPVETPWGKIDVAALMRQHVFMGDKGRELIHENTQFREALGVYAQPLNWQQNQKEGYYVWLGKGNPMAFADDVLHGGTLEIVAFAPGPLFDPDDEEPE